MPELNTAPADASISGAEKLLTLGFENVTIQQVADANESKSADIASAATTALSTATASFLHVTGTTTITALGTVQAGTRRIVVFDGALTLTHNATSLIGNWRCVSYQRANGTPLGGGIVRPIIVACSDETTALTTGTAKVTFRMPYAFTLTAVRASVTTAPTGSVLTVDINEGGVSILSTKLTIDATEKTSTTAATPAVISDSALADDAEITIDIDTVGSTIAGAGLKVALIGYQA
jgi:hypothetical protein